jgi:hypothetical protein
MKQKDWREIHTQYIERWERREKQPLQDGPPHDPHAFNEYLRWLHRSTRVQVRQTYKGENFPPTPRTTSSPTNMKRRLCMRRSHREPPFRDTW